MLWGKMIDAEKAMRANNGGEAKALVPATWQLVRRASDGSEQVLAKHVLSYDVADNGTIVFSDGGAIYSIPAIGGSSAQLCTGKTIEHVTALG